MAGILVMVLPALAVAVLSAFPYRYAPEGIAMLRVSFHHAGEIVEGCREPTEEEIEQTPEHMRLEQICSRERSPVHLTLALSGRPLLSKSFPAGGLKHDWPSVAFEELVVQPGKRHLVAELRDGGDADDVVRFEGDVVFEPGRVVVLDFNRLNRRFEILGGGSGGGSARLGGLPYDGNVPAPDFTLTDQNGAPFRLAEQRGKAVLLFFGYTTCPDVCPTTLADLRRVQAALGAAAGRVRFALVTVDPERDTSQQLGSYLRSVADGSFVGLTGAAEELARVWKDYGVYVKREEAPESRAGYWVTHSALVYLIAPDGRLLTAYPFGTEPDVIIADLRRII